MVSCHCRPFKNWYVNISGGTNEKTSYNSVAISVKWVLFLAILLLPSCDRDEEATLDYEIEKINPVVRVRLFSTVGTSCISSNIPSLVRNAIDPSEKIEPYGYPGAKFENGFVRDMPFYMVDKNGLNIIAYNRGASSKGMVQFKYFSCDDFANSKFERAKTLNILLK